jgi:hypothetical protein
MRDIIVGDRLRFSDARECCLHVAVVCRPQAGRSSSKEARDDAKEHDKVDERAEFRVGPDGHDDQH